MRREPAGGEKRGDLAGGVDARVGAAGEGDGTLLAGQLADGLFERALDGGKLGLRLRTREG